MAPTAVSFTNNLSGAIAFSGIVKIKCDDMVAGDYVHIMEERNDGAYEEPGDQFQSWSYIFYPQKSALFELYGNYKIARSSSTIAVGYVEG
jgi:hypothetical protein